MRPPSLFLNRIEASPDFKISMEKKIIASGSLIADGTHEMDRQKDELVEKLRRLRKENKELTSMVKLLCSNYQSLQANFMKQQEKSLISSPRTMAKTLNLGIDTAENSNHGEHTQQTRDYSLDSGFSVSENSEEKDSKSLLSPCNKRKINYAWERSANEKGNSCMEEDSKNKKPEPRYLERFVPPKKILTVRRKSEAAMVSDGCQWRKYGQKMTKNSPWPRAYYRCAMGPSCPVKKQVQRCAQDPTIVNTTYEGEHNHFLSPVAMAAMNATSDHINVSGASPGLIIGNRLPFPASIATISSIGTSPTITLDFTDDPHPNPNAIPISGLEAVHPQLPDGSFLRQSGSLYNSNIEGQMLDPGAYTQLGQNPAADPNLIAALAAAIANSISTLGTSAQHNDR